MEPKVRLYIQGTPDNPTFDFCWSAKMGAEERSAEVRYFESTNDIGGSPYNVIVGSVEECTNWLYTNGYKVPSQIPIELFSDWLGREFQIVPFETIDTLEYPRFIKPASQIKAFTGFVARNPNDAYICTEGYRGDLIIQTPVSIVSEYRMYINNHSIMGMRHYQGDCTRFPETKFIRDCFEYSKSVLDYHSYTLDFGVLDSGETILVEPNDGWAIGNYGIEPRDYWRFVKDRWLQITGIRKKMDYIFK